MQVLGRLAYQLEVVLQAQQGTSKSQALLDRHVAAVAALKRQNEMLRQSQQMAHAALQKHEELSGQKLINLEVTATI